MAKMTRVLVADGDVETINDVSGKLRARGFVNLLEMSGEAAVARARSERPDVIVLGSNFNDIPVGQLVSQLREDEATHDTPVLLAVPEVDVPSWSDSFSAQIDGFIPGPIDEDDLFTHMTAALRLKTMHDELQRREETLAKLGSPGHIDPGNEPPPGNGVPPKVLTLNVTDPAASPAGQMADFADVKSASSVGESFNVLASDRPECVVLCGEPRQVLDICVDIRRNPSLFHMPVLVILPADAPNGEAAAAYRAGASEVMRSPPSRAELQARIGIMARQERMRSHMLAAYRAKITASALDEKTGLYSEAFLKSHLELLMEDAFRWDKSLSIMAITLPGMDRMRDETGAESVDSLFGQVAQVVSQLVRGEDLCARLGDESIVVIMPESALEATAVTMRRVIGVVSFTDFAVKGSDTPIAVRPEVGSVEFRPGDTGADLLERAVSTASASQAA